MGKQGPVPLLKPAQQARDSESISPEELIGYVITRLYHEVAADLTEARRLGIPAMPGQAERNIAITNLRQSLFWLGDMRRYRGEPQVPPP